MSRSNASLAAVRSTRPGATWAHSFECHEAFKHCVFWPMLSLLRLNAATDSAAMLPRHRSAATRVLDYRLLFSLSVNCLCRLRMESPCNGLRQALQIGRAHNAPRASLRQPSTLRRISCPVWIGMTARFHRNTQLSSCRTNCRRRLNTEAFTGFESAAYPQDGDSFRKFNPGSAD